MDSMKNSNINKYLENEFNYDNTQVLKYVNEDNKLTVTLIGHKLNDDEISKIKKSRKEYNIEDVKVDIKQLSFTDSNIDKLISQSVKAESSEEEIDELQTEILAYKSQLANYEQDDIDVEEITNEAKTIFPKIKRLCIGYLSNYDEDKKSNNKEVYALVKVSEGLSDDEKEKLTSYLKIATKKDNINLIENVEK